MFALQDNTCIIVITSLYYFRLMHWKGNFSFKTKDNYLIVKFYSLYNIADVKYMVLVRNEKIVATSNREICEWLII